ncbi:MAG: hypothetical protein WCD11_09965 [Solirubrobacteraceae bacterium]
MSLPIPTSYTAADQWWRFRDRQRARPVVVARETRGRHFMDRGEMAVDASVTNESSQPVRNVSFGVALHGADVPWSRSKDSKEELTPGRLDVLAPQARFPHDGAVSIRLPDDVHFGGPQDEFPDVRMYYWAEYDDGAVRWRSENPKDEARMLTIKRVSRWSRRRRVRRLARVKRDGQKRIKEMVHELTTVLDRKEQS